MAAFINPPGYCFRVSGCCHWKNKKHRSALTHQTDRTSAWMGSCHHKPPGVRLSHFSRVRLWDPMTCPAPLSMGFSRQEFWSGLPLFGVFLTQGSNPGLLVSCIGKRILYHLCPWRSLLKYGQFVLPEVNSDFSKVSAAESSFPAAHESSGTRGQPSISRTTTVTRSSPASPLPHLPRSIAHVKHLQVQETLSNMGGSWESQEQGLHHSNADDFTGSLKHTLTLQSGLYMRLGL